MRGHFLWVLLQEPRASGWSSEAKERLFLLMAQLEGLDTVQLGLLLRVVCALPTKWSWGLSHPSPPGMVAMVSFPAWTKGRVVCWQCGCSSHRQTRW